MAKNILSTVEQRTNLAFSNQMEMMTFTLPDDQLYGINVFKILSIIRNPGHFTRMIGSHESVRGSIRFQEHIVPIIDLAVRLAILPVGHQHEMRDILICEYNNSIQGFLVARRRGLLTKSWSDVLDPRAGGLQKFGYLTAMTYDPDGTGIQILNIEDLLNDMFRVDDRLSSAWQAGQRAGLEGLRLLVVDDSKTARMMVQSVLEQLGVAHVVVNNADEAWATLQESVQADGSSAFNLIVSDIEMPGMDGFTLTRRIKAEPCLATIPVLLHSSMSNDATKLKAEQVGANGFLAKFKPDDLAQAIHAYAARGG
ncbi:MAG: chemotaxis protein CheV [Magnetococcales bacterium]|nr:chemotaxis protein CheV [Magnetococcales bacterium]